MFFISETFPRLCVATSHSDATDWHSLWCQHTWPVSWRRDCVLIIEVARRRHDVIIRLVKLLFSCLKLHWRHFLDCLFEELSRFLHLIHIVVRCILNLRFEKLLALRVVVHTWLAANHRGEFVLHRHSRKLWLVWRFDNHSLPSYRDARGAWLLLHPRSHLPGLLVLTISVSCHSIDIIPVVAQENIIVVFLHLVLGHQAVKLLFIVLMDVHWYLAAMLALVVIWVSVV